MKVRALVLFLATFFCVHLMYDWWWRPRFQVYIGEENGWLDGPWLSFIIVLIISVFITLTLIQLKRRRFNLYFIYVSYSLYFVTMIFFLFFKSVGSYGYYIGITILIDELKEGKIVEALFNILYFVPLGMLLTRLKRSVFFLVSLLGLFLIEISQYSLELGYFDTNDILLNFLGLYLGRFLWLQLNNEIELYR